MALYAIDVNAAFTLMASYPQSTSPAAVRGYVISKQQPRKEAAMPKQTKSKGKSHAQASMMKNALALLLTLANALVPLGDIYVPVHPNTP